MLTLSDCYADFLQDMADLKQLSPNTIRAYQYELALAVQDARFQRPLKALTLSDLERWVSREPSSPSTIGRRAAAFSKLFDWAVRHDLCDKNPLKDRAPIRIKRRLPRPIQSRVEKTSLDSAIMAASGDYRLIFTLLRETGMRVGEVLNLRVDDVLLDRGQEALRVREPKNGSERMVILGATATPKTLRGLRSHLKELHLYGRHELLFRSNRGTKLSYDAVHYQWKKVCAKAGLLDEQGHPKYTIHQLRHTRGSELIADGQRIEIVQRVLGHRDIRSTLGYAQLNDDQVRAALEQPRRH